MTLPRCTSRVLVVSHQFNDKRYNYEMTVDTASLIDWSAKHIYGSFSSKASEQAALTALPYWLQMADVTDRSVSVLPKSFFHILCVHHSTFLEMSGTQVYCNECHRIVDDISRTETHLPPIEIFDVWKYEWHCPSGHLLYQDEVGRHASIRRDRFRHLTGQNIDPIDVPNFLRRQAK